MSPVTRSPHSWSIWRQLLGEVNPASLWRSPYPPPPPRRSSYPPPSSLPISVRATAVGVPRGGPRPLFPRPGRVNQLSSWPPPPVNSLPVSCFQEPVLAALALGLPTPSRLSQRVLFQVGLSIDGKMDQWMDWLKLFSFPKSKHKVKFFDGVN